MPGEITKGRLLGSLDDATRALQRAVASCAAVQDVKGLPEAFPVVANRLPILPRLLESIEMYLKSGQESNETKEKYSAVHQLAEECRTQARYLEDLFGAVTATKHDMPAMERYRKAVSDGEGMRIESVLKDLLEQAIDVAVEPFVGDDVNKELQETLNEIAALKPSLKEQAGGHTTLNNYSSGNQFQHSGQGDQNHCSGGIQITGKGTTNHISSDAK